MLILTGILRQFGEATIKEAQKLKLVVEHETPRNDGTTDLHLETFFLDPSESTKLPSKGAKLSLVVRPWVSGRNVAYSAITLLQEGKQA